MTFTVGHAHFKRNQTNCQTAKMAKIKNLVFSGDYCNISNYSFIYTDLFKSNVKQVLPTYINHSRSLSPDGKCLSF